MRIIALKEIKLEVNLSSSNYAFPCALSCSYKIFHSQVVTF